VGRKREKESGGWAGDVGSKRPRRDEELLMARQTGAAALRKASGGVYSREVVVKLLR